LKLVRASSQPPGRQGTGLLAVERPQDETFCFGTDGLLRRQDYTVDILGGGTGLNYATNYQDIEGIIVPTTRRIYAYTGDYQRVPEPVLVAIDITDVKLGK
jgi:hypothetical protein